MRVAGVDARPAYDLAAAEYDAWSWQAFWRRHESPTVLAWLGDGRGLRLLDLGSGTGYYMARLTRQGFACTGLDISISMLGLSAPRLGSMALHVQGDAALLPFAADSFDRVLMTRVMSHVADPTAVFREVRRVTRAGGGFVLTDIDPAHDYERTELPWSGRRIGVTTFKRTQEELVGMAAANGGFTLSDHAMLDETGAVLEAGVTARPLAFLARFES